MLGKLQSGTRVGLSFSRVRMTFHGSLQAGGWERESDIQSQRRSPSRARLRMLSDTLHRSRWCSQLDSCHYPRTPGSLLRSHLQAPFLDNAPVLELLGPPASAKNRSYLQREIENHSLWQRLLKKKKHPCDIKNAIWAFKSSQLL